MSVERAFRRALHAALDTGPDAEALLPTAVARACAATVPADGAGLSVVTQGQRVPLGSSDGAAATAESLQFTAGDGPCLSAIRDDVLIDAPAPLLSRRWPALADLWHQHTPFCSATSLPLRLRAGTRGAINLFFRHGDGGLALRLPDVHALSVLAADTLDDWSARSPSTATAVAGSLATVRGQVWLAAGMIMQSARSEAAPALALLRAWAYGHGVTVDEAAWRLVHGQLRVADVLDG